MGNKFGSSEIGIRENIPDPLISEFIEEQHEDSKLSYIVERIITNCLRSYSKNAYEIKEGDLKKVLDEVRKLFCEEEMMLEIEPPVTIFGDIHGQFEDLITMLNSIGFLNSEKNLLFLGNYCNLGNSSIETLTLLFALKLKYPKRVSMLRGNHECPIMTKMYGLQEECIKKGYSHQVWKGCNDVFNCLPICASIDKKIFCVHGGISENFKSFDSLEAIIRPTDIPKSGFICDFLWADIVKNEARSNQVEQLTRRNSITKTSKKLIETDEESFKKGVRGVSKSFTEKAVDEFFQNFRFELIIRSHEYVENGYRTDFNSKVITIFSAPNLCGRNLNDGKFWFI